jgi:hypothetical protein
MTADEIEQRSWSKTGFSLLPGLVDPFLLGLQLDHCRESINQITFSTLGCYFNSFGSIVLKWKFGVVDQFFSLQS